MRFAPLLLFAAACGGHYRTEIVGHGALGGSVQLASGAYDVDLAFQLPRAQVVDWSVMCGGVAVAQGAVGELFEHYRERRLAELKKARADEKATAAGVTSLLVGAVAPRAKAGNVTASVDPNAAGAVVGASIDDHVELAPGDVGGGRLVARAHLTAPADGPCIVAGVADDPTVTGEFTVSRVHDLDAEAHERVVVATAAAVQLRSRLSTQLVGLGADADARERRRLAFEAEAQRRHLEAEARAELALRAETERRQRIAIVVEQQRQLAFAARARLEGVLVLWGADAGLRARQRAELELRANAERAEHDRRIHIEAELIAERERAQVAIALRARTQLRGYLVGLGAVERPPMPALIVEARGTTPFDGAVWLEGHWTWSDAQWTWTRGGWKDPGRFGETGGGGEIAVVAPAPSPVVVVAPPAVVISAPPPPPSAGAVVVVTPAIPTIVISGHARVPAHPHRPPPPPPARKDPVVRDHRK